MESVCLVGALPNLENSKTFVIPEGLDDDW
jgi:hypothetical protein